MLTINVSSSSEVVRFRPLPAALYLLTYLQVWSCLSPGIDQHVMSLSLYARYRLAELLDHKDWTALGKALQLDISDLDEEDESQAPMSIYSVTDGLIADWVQATGLSLITIDQSLY